MSKRDYEWFPYQYDVIGPAHPLFIKRTVAHEIVIERIKQDGKWGEQNHPDGTGSIFYRGAAEQAKKNYEALAREGAVTWASVLEEEFFEAMEETDPDRLRAELIQVAAVAAAWAEAIDRRRKD